MTGLRLILADTGRETYTMAAYAKTKIFYISIGFWLILEENEQQIRERNGSRNNDTIYSKPEDPVIYSTINDEDPNDANKDITTYSTIDHVPGSEAVAPDVFVVNSSVSGHEGGDISVQCFYSSGYKNKSKQWCRYKDQSCYTVGRTDTSQNSSVQISDDDGRRSFTVLMTGLRLIDSGWYWCSAGEALSSVHITVAEAKPGTVSDKDNEPLIVWLLPALAALLLLLILVGVFTWRLRRRPSQFELHYISVMP
ncbi:hypothetical protein cypCar_00039082 [Cyprinus carpio]|nr:hypothetical protein cypCar_00039082 [Cyprinus carpio]